MCSKEMETVILEEREKVKQAEYRTLNKIKELPLGFMMENRALMAGYTPIANHNLHAKKEAK